ncbi:hypothetical protein SPRG_03395 [Saprolegnia parasitica CBS 223.65]|uniref:Uncharacterized protein n=1 Tax=Saprolegnia parasitica (strain CBS 223.65) TaxID=695850 RepID=A0A067CNY5_SAPPC|nr:hypothetical protein SPRG_03395 [Saprolegnia parasitica CBS 223.65]KDO32178.1 hypothetical protein SPRG_03395 [Saprolegnia parasitica CBS 223.65]|eukprot:XP_012197359.1 hypothetical protein SPRG_03395 [Saprolegnia parasitica CBS 223.65]
MEWNGSDSEDDEHGDGSPKWPYANALAKLTSEDDFLCTPNLPRQVKPPPISIGDTTFRWPLTKPQAQQLETLHGTNAVITAPELCIPDFDAWWATMSPMVLAPARQVLDIDKTAAVGVTLSHLVIDVSGSGDVLKAQAATPNTFGSVIIILPSARKGGAIKFAHGGAAERFDAPPSATFMRVAVTYLQTTITSARLSSGCRYALVLNLVALDGPRSPMPPAMLRAIDAFKELAARPSHKHRRIACELKPINHKLLWEKLGPTDKYLVDVLLATGAYDVVLVGFKKERDYDAEPPYDSANEGDWDYDKPQYKIINTVARFKEHPACPIPAAMHLMLVTRGAHAFPDMEDRLENVAIPATSVLFWPKQFRAEIIGVHRALQMLQNAINDPAADLLGYASVHDLAQSTSAIFGCGSLKDPIPAVDPILLYDPRPATTTFVTTMGSLLRQLNDVDVVISFLRDAVTIRPNTPLDVVAPVVHTLLSTFGWMRLADAMLGLVQRWLCSTSRSLLQLLSSLEGVSAQPVCAALRQPCFGEFLKAAWSTLVHHDPLQFDYTGSNWRTAFLCDLLLLGAHVERSIPEDTRENWLGAYLPPTLISVVDDYIHPRRSALAALQDNMYKRNAAALLAHLPQALLDAVTKRPEMQLAPFADALLAAFDAMRSTTQPRTLDVGFGFANSDRLRDLMGPGPSRAY